MAEHLLNVTGLSKAYGPRTLFDGVSFGLDAGEKIGLIGDNGTGKSTFLAILAGTQEPDSGTIAIRNGVRLGILEQVPHLDPQRTARAVIAEPLAPLVAAIRRYEEASAALDPGAETWLHTIEQLGGWDWAHRIEKVASEAGVAALDVPIAQLSGGQRRRVALARLLLEEPDILLFDEPTNHLDAETTEWLEAWIGKTSSACVIVTHDRYFLENVVTRMAELRDGLLRMYEGSYQDYLVARAEEEELRRRTGQRRLQVLKSELDWARRAPSARSTKQRARLDRVDGLADEVKKLQQEARRSDFQLDSAPRLGKTILELAHVTAGFDADPPIIEDLTLMVRRGERFGIIGPNGSGKTTLLRLVTGELEPRAGAVIRGKQTGIAYFDQHRSILEDDKTVRATVCPEGGDKVFVGEQQLHAVSYLERFGFDAAQHGMKVGSLSGGERNRLALARFLLADANVLLFDEPTNDLDLMTMHTLEEALLGFGGCVLVVSHDRYFLDRVATTMVVFESSGPGPARVTVQPGDYTTWRRLQLADAAAGRAAASEAAEAERRQAKDVAAAQREVAPPSKGKRTLTWAERRELEGIEPRIEVAEQRVATLDAALSDAGVWADGGVRGRALQAERERAKAELDALFARWEELMTVAGGA